ncbi:MAG: pilus assembly protein N-terminal domain-containing protein [Myxococcaceae bacterium]|nr:pilus assembly protein N-terminal domain-containing protein [Myxococcaceae bacterium]
MHRLLVLALVLFTTSALAGDLEVPLGDRAPLKSRKAIHEVQVRDPSMLKVVVTDGQVSLEGTASGVTGVTVKYEDGELERMLIVVGDAKPSKGPRMERAQTVDLKQSANATAKTTAKPAPASAKATKEKAAVEEANGVVRNAIERL